MEKCKKRKMFGVGFRLGITLLFLCSFLLTSPGKVSAGFPVETFNSSTGWGTGYYSGSITFNGNEWEVASDYRVAPTEEAYDGYSHRLDDNVTGYIRTHEFSNGAGTFTFYAATWDSSNQTVVIEKSINGTDWTIVESNFTITGSGKAWNEYQVEVNDAEARYLKLTKSGTQERLSLDNFSVLDYATPAGITIEKTSPGQVVAGDAFTYTLVAANNTGAELTGLVLSDTLPGNVTFSSASDGGSYSDNTVVWAGVTLADGSALTRTFCVTAPTTYGTVMVNSAYTATATNWATPTTGLPVTTTTALPLTVAKVSPASVENGSPFTYTFTVHNGTDETLTELVLSDNLTHTVGFLGASGSYTLTYAASGWSVDWDLGSLSADVTVTRTLTVLAPLYPGTLVNDNYAVWASAWSTPSTGLPVATTITDGGATCVTSNPSIAQIQTRGGFSPCDPNPYDTSSGSSVSGVVGCVTGVGSYGFYMQDLAPDDDPYTSDGIYVYMGYSWENTQNVTEGKQVTVNGKIVEYYNMTEFAQGASVSVSGSCTLPDPVDIPNLVSPYQNPEMLYERFEGMLVNRSAVDGFVEGPTTRYAPKNATRPNPYYDPLIAYVPMSFIDNQLLVNHPRVFQEDYAGYGGLMYLSGELFQDLPPVEFGDEITGSDVTGILAYQFDKYQLSITAPYSDSLSVTGNPAYPVYNALDPLTTGQFGVCTFNLENLFDTVDDGDGDVGDWSPVDEAEYQLWVDKRAKAIAQVIPGCTVIGVEEVEGKDPVWQDLTDAINAELGTPGAYAYDYYEVTDSRDISVGIFYNQQKATLVDSTQRQGCSDTSYSISYASADDTYSRVIPNPCGGSNPPYPLFNRAPYVGQLRIEGSTPLTFTVIVNHFKSKRGGEHTERRTAQAEWVAQLVAEYNQEMPVIVLGDLNDYLNSVPIQALGNYDIGGGEHLINVMQSKVARANRYSFIFSGESEVLDHYLMTPDLAPYFVEATPVHINSDYPELLNDDTTYHRSSDHDPVFVRYSMQGMALSKEVSLGSDVVPGSVVTYTITVTPRGTGGQAVLTDDLASSLTFGGWETLPPGAVTSGDLITWAGDVTAETTFVFTATINEDEDLYGKPVVNTAQLEAEGVIGTASATFTVTNAPVPADFKPSYKEVDAAYAYAGDLLTYTLVLSNSGELSGSVRITDVLHSVVDFVSASDDLMYQGGALTWQGDIDADASRVFTATVQVKPAEEWITGHYTQVTNTLLIADGSGSVLQRPAPVVALQHFTLTKQVDPMLDVALGESVTYTLNVIPWGTTPASIVLSDVLSTDLIFGGWVVRPDSAQYTDGAVSWMAEVAESQSLVFTATVAHNTALYNYTVPNTAALYWGTDLSTTASASFSVTSATAASLRNSSKTVNATQAAPGDILTYTLSLVNSGQVSVTVSITDSLHPAVEFVEATQGMSYAGGSLTWQGEVAALATEVFTLQVRVKDSAELAVGDYTHITNALQIDDGTGSLLVRNAPEVTLHYWSFEKQVTPQFGVSLGGVVTYTLHLNPVSELSGDDYVLSDALPDAVDFGGWVIQPDSATVLQDVLFWSGSTTETLSFVFTATVHTDSGLLGATVTNTATVSHNGDTQTGVAAFDVATSGSSHYIYLPLLKRN